MIAPSHSSNSHVPFRPCSCRARICAAATVVASLFALPDAVIAEEDFPVYKDANARIDDRVADLLGRMTLEEKVAQMLCLWHSKATFVDDEGHVDPVIVSRVMPLSVGEIARPSDRRGEGDLTTLPGRGVRETVEFVNAVQRYAINETRLGIPIMFHEEGLHGYKARESTHFPQAIALASSWDPDLVERVNRVIGREIAARGVRHVLSPVVDVCRDPRWGRIEETFGEDPYLCSEMGLAAVRGLQGDTLPLAPGHVVATLKHMTGHGEPESGINVGPANISERALREFFFPPFRRAVQEGGALAVMASYNEIDGVPSHANRWLLGDVLRDEWGFEGVVVGDYSAVRELQSRHAVANDLADAARLAVSAGVDIELPVPEAFPNLAELVQSGVVEEAKIDRAVDRLLRIKFLARLFDDPYADADYAERITSNDEARKLAAEAARRSIILLKNEGRLLPLDRDELTTLAVIGPNAGEAMLGGYSDVPKYSVNIVDGLRAKLGDDVEVRYAEGCRITEGHNVNAHSVIMADSEENRRRIADAVDIAREADVVLLVLGGNEHTSREGYGEHHLGDRADLLLVGEQDELIAAILELGKPTVLLLIHGQPVTSSIVYDGPDALLEGWYLGQETGTAVADVLFGDANPAGKLTVTIPRSVGQIPVFYNHKPTARRGYLFSSVEPRFPFGYGMSYTTFKYDNLRLSAHEISVVGEGTTALVDVTNTGDIAGDEVVQLYVRDVVSSVTRPVKELKAFRRMTLHPGETRTVELPIGREALAFYDYNMDYVVEPGEFQIMVGRDSHDLDAATLTVHE